MKEIIFLVFGFIPLAFLSQRIKNVDYTVKGGKVIVRYDLGRGKEKMWRTDVSLLFKDSLENVIRPRNISGDVFLVRPGRKKEIVWDALKDTGDFSGRVRAEISIKDSAYYPGGFAYVPLSMLLPGLGDYFIDDNVDYRLIPASAIMVGYGFSVVSARNNFLNYRSAQREKNNLARQLAAGVQLSNEDFEKSTANLNAAKKNFIASVAVAGTIWLYDVYRVSRMACNNRRYNINTKRKKNLVYLFPTSAGPTLGYVRTF